MSPAYHSSNKKHSSVLGVAMGIAVSALIFSGIPLTQIFTEYNKNSEDIQAIEVAPPPPPPPLEEPPPPPPPQEETPLPEFEPPPPPISLEQLDIALEAGTGEALAGDFVMPNLTISKDELGGLDIFDINDLDKKPRSVKQVPPTYPIDATPRGLSGYANAQFVIDTRGNVVQAKITSSSDPIFEKPTINALRQWKFTPGEKGGKIVTTRAETRIPYTIQ